MFNLTTSGALPFILHGNFISMKESIIKYHISVCYQYILHKDIDLICKYDNVTLYKRLPILLHNTHKKSLIVQRYTYSISKYIPEQIINHLFTLLSQNLYIICDILCACNKINIIERLLHINLSTCNDVVMIEIICNTIIRVCADEIILVFIKYIHNAYIIPENLSGKPLYIIDKIVSSKQPLYLSRIFASMPIANKYDFLKKYGYRHKINLSHISAEIIMHKAIYKEYYTELLHKSPGSLHIAALLQKYGYIFDLETYVCEHNLRH